VCHIAGAACAAGDELPLNGILRVATATSWRKSSDAINEAKEMTYSGEGRKSWHLHTSEVQVKDSAPTILRKNTFHIHKLSLRKLCPFAGAHSLKII